MSIFHVVQGSRVGGEPTRPITLFALCEQCATLFSLQRGSIFFSELSQQPRCFNVTIKTAKPKAYHLSSKWFDDLHQAPKCYPMQKTTFERHHFCSLVSTCLTHIIVLVITMRSTISKAPVGVFNTTFTWFDSQWQRVKWTYWKAEPILLPFSGTPGSGQTSPARPLWLTEKKGEIHIS